MQDGRSDTLAEREWREALLEAETLRQEYEQHLGDADGVSDANERAIGRLWRAERRRDDCGGGRIESIFSPRPITFSWCSE